MVAAAGEDLGAAAGTARAQAGAGMARAAGLAEAAEGVQRTTAAAAAAGAVTARPIPLPRTTARSAENSGIDFSSYDDIPMCAPRAHCRSFNRRLPVCAAWPFSACWAAAVARLIRCSVCALSHGLGTEQCVGRSEATGTDVPAAVTSFDEVDLGPALMANVKRCKYDRPTPVQRLSIPIGLAGRDLMACAQTGSGKTAAFCFPILANILKSGAQPTGRSRKAFPLALVLSPTRELSSQIYDEARKFCYQTGIRPVVVYGGAPVVNQVRARAVLAVWLALQQSGL